MLELGVVDACLLPPLSGGFAAARRFPVESSQLPLAGGLSGSNLTASGSSDQKRIMVGATTFLWAHGEENYSGKEGKMPIERICGAAFLVSIFESKFWKKGVANRKSVTH